MFVGLCSIWVDIKELDADLKAIQQIQFVGQLKKNRS